MLFGRIDLDLRTVVLSQDQVTVSVRSLFGSVTIIVPKAWRIEEQVLVARLAAGDRQPGQRRSPGADDPAAGVMLGGSFRLSDG